MVKLTNSDGHATCNVAGHESSAWWNTVLRPVALSSFFLLARKKGRAYFPGGLLPSPLVQEATKRGGEEGCDHPQGVPPAVPLWYCCCTPCCRTTRRKRSRGDLVVPRRRRGIHNNPMKTKKGDIRKKTTLATETKSDNSYTPGAEPKQCVSKKTRSL